MSAAPRSTAWSLCRACSWLLLFSALQGCLAGAWVGVVGLDVHRTADITFMPFEHSWVSQQDPARPQLSASTVRSIAVAPFQGDAVMASRMAGVLEEWTMLRVVGPSEVFHAEESVRLARAASGNLDDHLHTLAHAICAEVTVDAVLLGEVVDIQIYPSDWGWKDQESKRLYLYLVDPHGDVLWKDELPFMVTKGSKPPLEEAIRETLASQLMMHADKIGLGEIGLVPRRIPS